VVTGFDADFKVGRLAGLNRFDLTYIVVAKADQAILRVVKNGDYRQIAL
jgi:hypothetical protein